MRGRSFKLLLLVFAILFTLAQLGYDKAPDHFYYYNEFPVYSAKTMIFLTLGIGRAFTLYVADSLMGLRFLSWAMCVASIVMAYLTFCPRRQWWRHTPWLAAGVLFLGSWSMACYSSYPPALLFMTAMLCVVYKRDIYRPLPLLAAAALSAAVVACRFPSVFIIPAVALYYIASAGPRGVKTTKAVAAAAAYSVASVAICLAIYCAVAHTTNPLDYFTALRDSVIGASTGGHSTSSLIRMCITDVRVFGLSAVVIAALLVGAWRCGMSRCRWLQIVVLVAACLAIPVDRTLLDGETLGWKSFFTYSAFILAAYNAWRSGSRRQWMDTALLVAAA